MLQWLETDGSTLITAKLKLSDQILTMRFCAFDTQLMWLNLSQNSTMTFTLNTL